MENSFEHHGVLGMHWGVRRYQPYPKGSKVQGGKEIGEAAKAAKRRAANNKAAVSTQKKATKTATSQTKSEPEKKSVKTMSEEELRTAIGRMKLEKEFSDLLKATTPAPKSSAGKAMVKKILNKSAENIGEQLGVYLTGAAVNKIAKSLFGAEKDIVNPYKGQKPK